MSKNKSIIIALHDDTIEIKQLAESLDYDIISEFIQHRKNPDTKSYIGSGKLKEIKEFLKNNTNVNLIIIDGELKPSQWFLLEKEFKIQVYDRYKLILMIFKQRAQRKEAKLQVRLAELEYEKPYVKELIHRTRSGEHPGLMAGGEYQVDDYFEMIKKQIKIIKKKLNKIENDRITLRKHRHKTGFFLISLAGYTNAGKSSLINILTNESIEVKDQLFSTLSTTTRKLNSEKIPILFTDTVGFISNLPSWIINAFHSTLEEIKKADLVICVVDVSDRNSILLQKMQTSIKEFRELQVKAPILFVLNKIDLISKEQLKVIMNNISNQFSISSRNILPFSVKNSIGIKELIKKILETLPNLHSFIIYLPQTSETASFLSWLYEKTYVVSITYTEQIEIKLKCNIDLKKKIHYYTKKYHGKIIE